MAERAARGELAADGDVSSFVHVGDAACAAAEALSWPARFVNVCDDVPPRVVSGCPRSAGPWGWRSRRRLLAASGMGGRGALTTGTRVRS